MTTPAQSAEARERYLMDKVRALTADLDAARAQLAMAEKLIRDAPVGGFADASVAWHERKKAFLAPPADSPVPAEPASLLRRLDPLGAYRTEDDFVSDFEGQRDALETLTASRCSALFDGDYLAARPGTKDAEAQARQRPPRRLANPPRPRAALPGGTGEKCRAGRQGRGAGGSAQAVRTGMQVQRRQVLSRQLRRLLRCLRSGSRVQSSPARGCRGAGANPQLAVPGHDLCSLRRGRRHPRIRAQGPVVLVALVYIAYVLLLLDEWLDLRRFRGRKKNDKTNVRGNREPKRSPA